MRISDWSSDVCSSDLVAVIAVPQRHHAPGLSLLEKLDRKPAERKAHHPVHRVRLSRTHQIGEFLNHRPLACVRLDLALQPLADADAVALGGRFGDVEIGRESWWERVGQSGELWGVAVSLKKKNI